MNQFIVKFKNKTLNQLVARWMIGQFEFEDLKSPELKIAISYWLDNL